MRRWWTAVVAFWPAVAGAQTVFFDDFDGPDFLPHWSVPPPSRWSYNFDNGMLNVTGLHYPSNPHSSGNWAFMSTTFAPQTDFRVDAWVGWDAGKPWHRLGIHLVSQESFSIASFTYTDEPIFGPGARLFAGTGTQAANSAAPPPGIHHLTIARTGGVVAFFVDGAPFTVLLDVNRRPGVTLMLEFVRSYPGEFAPLYVDRLQVVPCPGSVAFLSVALLFGARPRRRPWATPWTSDHVACASWRARYTGPCVRTSGVPEAGSRRGGGA